MNTSIKRFYVIKADSSDLDRYKSCLDMGGPEDAIIGLARAIASSPLWSEMSEATLVVRLSPPVIAVFGGFDEVEEARLEALATQIKYGILNMHYVSYSQLEVDCRLLVDILIERFGRDELNHFSFTAVPRGGIIVLGLLSYILGLNQEQLDSPFSPDVPLVVVDDCAITGNRLGHFLNSCNNNRIIFAPLYSHPDLRTSIMYQEPRVITCLSAKNLNDHWEKEGENRIELQRLWLSRLEGRRYWFGRPDYLCFAWNEPDWIFWNPIKKKLESGWRLIPPEKCLKNNRGSIPIQIQAEGKGPLGPTNKILFATYDDFVVIGNLESGESFSLEDVAAGIWNAIIDHGEFEKIADSLLSEYMVNKPLLRRDLEIFIKDLKAFSVLEEKDGKSC